MKKQYETRDGRYTAEILRDDLSHSFYQVIVVLTSKENGEQEVHQYTKGLLYSIYTNTGQDLDLIEVSPYADWKVGDKIEVSDDGECWYKRYFSRVDKDGEPCAFLNGGTSWSSNGLDHPWHYARKPEGLK